MSARRVKIVLLCEDSQHEAFARRFLAGMGWNTREIRVERSPAARGSAEQWVREKFVDELAVYRQRRQRAASALIVMIDADGQEVEERVAGFAHSCSSRQVAFRGQEEAVALVIPKRNIETWIHYLESEQQVDEQTAYQKLTKQKQCRSAVKKLLELCQTVGLPDTVPPSLVTACDEYRQRVVPMSGSTGA